MTWDPICTCRACIEEIRAAACAEERERCARALEAERDRVLAEEGGMLSELLMYDVCAETIRQLGGGPCEN